MDNQEQASPQGSQQDSGTPVEFMVEVGKGLEQVAKLFEQAGAPPDLVKEIGAISQRYNTIVRAIPGQESAPQEPVSRTPEEVGNARPQM